MYLGGGSVTAGDLRTILDHEAYFECEAKDRHIVGLRLYLELGLLTVQECCKGGSDKKKR